MKKLLKHLKLLIIAIVVGLFFIISHNNNRILIRNEIIESEKFDENIDDYTVIFFSDLHYGSFIKQNFLNKLVDTINNNDPDLVIFGGDLIDKLDKKDISDEDKKTLIDGLKKIETKDGKYAILGNHDYCDGSYEIVKNIYEQAGFQLLKDKCVSLFTNNNTINLLGIDSMYFSWDLFLDSYKDLDSNNFTFALIHHPDLIDYLFNYDFDYVLSGHSHGGQIYIKALNKYYDLYGCKKYFKGKYSLLNNNNQPFIIDVSNGVGRTIIDLRMNADAEIVKYQLMHK